MNESASPVNVCPPFVNDEAELEALAGMVGRAIEGGAPAKTIAVLCRTNDTAEAVARLLAAASVPCQHLGQRRDRIETEAVRAALAVARLAVNPADDLAVLRALRCPHRDALGSPSFEKRLRDGAQGGSLLASVRRAKAWAEGDEAGALSTFEAQTHELARSCVPEDDTAWVTAYADRLESLAVAHEALHFPTRAADLRWLRGLLFDYAAGRVRSRRRLEKTLRGFLFWTLHGQGAGEHDPEADAVTISTVHLAKGLEWPIVFVPGLVERVFPSFQAVDRGDTTEELRTFFVAATRAADRLVLTSCRSISPKGPWGLPFQAAPSRFLRYASA